MTPYTSKVHSTYANSGIQFSEFALKRGGTWLAWPSGTTAATANTYNLGASGGQNAAQLINRTVSGGSDKLYDTAYADPVTITFGAEMEFETYDLATGGDCQGRDPAAWTLEVGRKVNGALTWYPTSGVTDYYCTDTRNAWMNANFQCYDLAPRFTGAAITVAEGATLEVVDCVDELADADVKGALVRTGRSPLASAPAFADGTLRLQGGHRARYFRFQVTKTETGTTNMQISEFRLLLGGRHNPWPSGTSCTWSGGKRYGSNQGPDKIIDNNISTKCYDSSTVGVFEITAPQEMAFDGYCWYTAGDDYNRDPVSWNFQYSLDGKFWNTLDTVNDRACTVGRNSLAYTRNFLEDGKFFAKFLRYSITSVRSGNNQMQFSEFELLTNGVKVAWPSLTRLGWSLARSRSGGTSDTESPAKLIDGSGGTKFYTTMDGCGSVMIYCPGGVGFDSYRWYTANDSASTRDPIGWKFEASDNGLQWVTLDTVPSWNTTATRTTVAYTKDAQFVDPYGLLPNADAATLDAATLEAGGGETFGGLAGTGAFNVAGDSATLNVAASSVAASAFGRRP